MTHFLTRFAALVIVVLIPTIAWPQSNFTDPIYIKTPQKGTFPVSGDFNGDSKTDLAYWTSDPDLDLYVWYNEGDHNFTKSFYSVEGVTNLKGLEVGDFNGDGKDDIVSFETTANGSKILVLTSTGTSWTQTTAATTSTPAVDLKVAKFNDDDHLDFLVTFSGSDVVAVAYLGDGAGAFTAEPIFHTTGLLAFRYIDLNHDDQMDFIGLNNDKLKILIKNADGYTASEKTFDQTPFDFEVANFDADEFPDVAISFNNSTTSKIEIFKNAGDATFPTAQSISVSQNNYLLAHADYDNDGLEDLAASSFNTPSVLIFNNTLGGFVTQGPTQTKGNASVGIIFADMDGDDVDELVELRWQEINIYARTVFNSFELDQTIILALFASRGVVADMNNDGHNDIVAPSSKAVSIQYGHGDFTFDAPVFTQVVGDFQVSILVGYFDNDEFKDVIYTGNGETGIMRSDNGVLKEPEIIFGGSLSSLASADFNNDGHMDFAGQDYVMLGDGAGGFTQEFAELGVPATSIDVGYFNNDALPDLIMTSFDGIPYIALNSGTTPIFPVFEVIPDVTNQPLMVATKFNNDDLTDFVVGGYFVKTFSVLTNDGDGTFTKKDITLGENEGVFAAMPSFADFDNDGRVDVAVPYSNIPANGGIGIFMQDANGNLNFKDKIDFNPMQAPGEATLGDLNGDEELDIVGFDLNSVNGITIVPSLYQPKAAPTTLTASNVTGTTVKLSLQKGDGSGRIIFIRASSETNAVPSDNILYVDKTAFGSGTGPSASIFAVIKGDITEVTVTNLAKGTAYTAMAYEYNETVAGTMADYLPTVAEVQFTTKKDQTITVTAPGDKVMGTAPFTIVATSTSGLPVTFEAVTTNISVTGNSVSVLSPGPAKVKALQAGNSEFSPAVGAEVTFCVNPTAPTIAIEDRFGGKYLLKSSYDSNNQWLLNGTAIIGATSKTFEPTQDGIYSVKVDFSGCTATSQPTNYLITGFEEIEQSIVVYPNPIRDVVTIQTGPLAINSSDVLFTDATGRQHFFNGRQEGSNRLTVNIASTLVRGLYVIEVQTNIGAVRKKVVID